MSVASSPAAGRLRRLAAWLEQDPSNAALLADACDAAIACGAHGEAERFLAAAERLALDPAPWQFRRAQLAIARRELAQAAELLEGLRAITGEGPVLAHDLAYVRLLQGDFEACRAVVQPWLEAARAGGPEQLGPLQLLWLRAMHRLQRLDEAMEWANARLAAGMLQPRALGAASLIALDQAQFDVAREWADAALAADAQQVEALVARGCVALASGEAERATALLEQALRHNAEDGRTWSALGMASLLAGRLPLAQSQLQQAVRHMPDHVGSWHALGWACLLQGNHAEALAAFRAALEIDRNFGETHGALGLVLALSGQHEAARHHLEVADRLEPANVTGRYARALLAGEAGGREAVERLALRLLDRRGFFGGTLGEAVLRHTRPRD